MKLLNPFRKLTSLGYLGINERNGHYIQGYNPRRFFHVVDSKLTTKKRALEQSIQVPALYHTIKIEHENRDIAHCLQNYDSFVLKPAQGCGGDGIWVFDRKHQNRFVRSNGNLVCEDEIMHHISEILSGIYSLGGKSDQAYFEYRVKPHIFFEPISYRGVPDVRVIVFRGVPVLAMLRLPTRASDGKANLHQGALGLGIHLESGKTRHAIHNNQQVHIHPDTLTPIDSLQLPYWHDVLRLAVQCSNLTELAYIGVDIVIDDDLGPMLLELNARPGLSIQLCNKVGLKLSLKHIERLSGIPEDIESRVALGKKIYQELNFNVNPTHS